MQNYDQTFYFQSCGGIRGIEWVQFMKRGSKGDF